MLPLRSKYRFGVKLDSANIPFFVADGHDFIIFIDCGYLKFFMGKPVSVDNP